MEIWKYGNINDVSDVLHLSSGYNSGLQILIKTYVLSMHHTGIKQYNIVTKYIDKLNNHLSRSSEEQYNEVKLRIW